MRRPLLGFGFGQIAPEDRPAPTPGGWGPLVFVGLLLVAIYGGAYLARRGGR